MNVNRTIKCNIFLFLLLCFSQSILDENFKGLNHTYIYPVFHYEGNMSAEKKTNEIMTCKLTFHAFLQCTCTVF